MAKKKIEELMYKERPLTRRGNEMFYGFIDDKFLVKLTVKETEDVDNLSVASKIAVQLVTNTTYLEGKERTLELIKELQAVQDVKDREKLMKKKKQLLL